MEKTARTLQRLLHCQPKLPKAMPAPNLSSSWSSGSVFATTRLFARPVFGSVCAGPCFFVMTRVFAPPVFGRCLRPPMCLRDDACLREVSAHVHVSLRRRVPSPDLPSGRCLVRVFAPKNVLGRNVSSNACVFSQTVLPNLSLRPHVSSKCVFGLRAICAPPGRPQWTFGLLET